MTPAGGAVPLVNLFLGEVIFGGVGSGLYGMFFYIVIAVFVAGPDGRANAGMAGEEDRGARDQVRGGRRALRARRWSWPSRRSRSRPKAGLASIFNPGVARLHRDALRLRLAGEQQRQRLRRLRADELQRRPRHDRDATSAASCRCSPRSRSAARSAKKKIVPASAGTFRTDGADVRRPARRRDRAHRRPDDLPGAHARADRRRADALMRERRQLGDRDRRDHRRLRLRATRC